MMINTIRADLYRFFKTASFHLTFAILLFFVTITVISESYGTVGINIEEALPPQETVELAWTGIRAIQNILQSFSVLPLFIAPILVIVLGTDFSQRTYKNILTIGISRTEYIISKLITLFLSISFLFMLFVGSAFLVGSIKNGVGEVSVTIISRLLIQFIGQIFYLYAGTLFGVTILYLTGNTIAAVLTNIFLPFIFQIIYITIDKFNFLIDYDFTISASSLGTAMLSSEDVLRLTLTALSVTVLAIVFSLWGFSKKEL